MATNNLYPDLECSFPQEIDNFERYLDPDIEALTTINQYYSYYEKGDLVNARKVLDDNPRLKRMIINADNLNHLRDMVIALERYYMDDIQRYLQNIINYRNEYSSTAKYEKYDVVYYVRNDARETFMAISSDIPVGTLPTNISYFIPLTLRGAQGASGTGLAPRGVWSEVVSYQKDDCVSWNDILWQCMADNAGNEPVESDPTYWIAILHVPQQVITSENMPEGQNSNDIWIQEYPDTPLVDIKRKKTDGSYENKFPKTVFNDGTPVETHNKDTGLHMVDAECVYNAGTSVYQIDLNGSFTAGELGNAVSVRFKAPNNYVSNSSFSLLGEEYSPSNMGFISDSIVVVHFDCTQKKCYAGSGGAGRKSATLVVGTVLSGHNSVDADYLCDGINDEEEINAALSSLPSGGGKVLILEGTYNISAPIKVAKDYTQVEGMGRCTVLKRCWASSVVQGVVELSYRKQCRLYNFCIDGGGFTNPAVASSALNYGIYCKNDDITSAWEFSNSVSANKFENLHIGNTETGISINGIQDVVSHCELIKGLISSSVFDGHNIIVDGVGCVISANVVTGDNLGAGIYAKGHQHVLSGNTLIRCKDGIEVGLGAHDITITSNIISKNNRFGIYMNTQHGNASITNNIVKYNRNAGISLQGCCICNVSNNIINNNGELIENHTSAGIEMAGIFGCTISGNNIDRQNTGIKLSETCKGNTIIGNTIQMKNPDTISTSFEPLKSYQHTITIDSTSINNLVTGNILTGRDCENEGSNNTVINNMYQAQLSKY